MWLVPDLRAFLCGSWRIERRLVDRNHGISGTFSGRATFTPAGTSLLYEERGALEFGAYRGTADQRYVYEFPAPGRAIVRFRDGRLFHELDLSSGQAAFEHACDPDFYSGQVTATGPTGWTSAWTIAGPRKRQEIRSLYTRVG